MTKQRIMKIGAPDLNAQDYIKTRNAEFDKMLETFMSENGFDPLIENEYFFSIMEVRDSEEWRRFKYSLKEKHNIELVIYEQRDLLTL